MKKKGYTLVELLAVFLIIAVIAALALTAIARYSNKYKRISNAKIEELIISSAKSYVYNRRSLKEQIRNGNPQYIPFADLKSSGYLSDKLKDLKTYEERDISDSCVIVTYENYKYVYEVEQPCD